MTTIPTKPQFFKPLIPGFEDEFLIPASFFKYLKGEECEKARLRSQGGKLWPVKINGRRFKDGWKQFVEDHDLKIGDFLVFRHEGDLVFDVMVFDRSTCEREYLPFTDAKEEEFEIREENRPIYTSSGKKLEKKKKVKTRLEAKASSSVLEHPTCVLKLTPDSIKKSKLYIPQDFTRECGLRYRSCSMVLKDAEEKCWPAKLLCTSIDGKFLIGARWGAFLCAQGLKPGDSLIIELLKNGETPVMKICKLQEHSEVTRKITKDSELKKSQLETPEVAKDTGSRKKLEEKKKLKSSVAAKASSCLLEYPYSVTQLTKNSLKKSKLHIPRKFARKNGLYGRCCSMILKDGEGHCWPAKLLYKSSDGKAYIAGGWISFRVAHKLKTGDSLIVELTRNGKIPVLRIRRLQECPEVKKEIMNQNNAEADSSSPGHFHAAAKASNLEKSQLQIPEGGANKSGCWNKFGKRKKVKTRSGAKASSSNLQHPNCVIELIRDSFKLTRVYLPKRFAKEHGLYGRCCSMILKDGEGNSWPAELIYRSSNGKMYVGGGWKSFRFAHKLKPGDSLLVELSRNGTIPVLKMQKVQEHPEVQEVMDQNNAEADSAPPGHFHATTEASSLEKSQPVNKFKTRLEVKASSSVLKHPNCVSKQEIMDHNNAVADSSSPGHLHATTEASNLEKSQLKIPEKVDQQRFFVAKIYDSWFDSKLYIPGKFARLHFQNNKNSKVILIDREGSSWPAYLQHNNPDVHIGDGWNEFRVANNLKPGDSFVFEFIKRGGRPAFKMCEFKTNEKAGTDQETASSLIEKPCFYVIVKSSYVRGSQIRIPADFASRNGLDTSICSEMTIKNEIGNSWPVKTKVYKNGGLFIRYGWSEFAKENGIKEGDVFMLELVKGGKKPLMNYYAAK